MQAVERIVSPRVPPYHQPATTITTTLYDLIEAIHEEVPSGNEKLVTAVVAHLLNAGRIRYIGNPDSLKIRMP
jgi:hypothetical protein